MSDEEEIGFDDWEAEADVAIEESKVEEPAKEQPQEEEVRPDVEEEKKEKVKVVDPHEALLSKIAHYKQLNDNTFDGLLEGKGGVRQSQGRTVPAASSSPACRSSRMRRTSRSSERRWGGGSTSMPSSTT